MDRFCYMNSERLAQSRKHKSGSNVTASHHDPSQGLKSPHLLPRHPRLRAIRITSERALVEAVARELAADFAQATPFRGSRERGLSADVLLRDDPLRSRSPVLTRRG